MKKNKFYVVWQGGQPGVYDNWRDCEAQVKRFSCPKFKSFRTEAEATIAYERSSECYIGKKSTLPPVLF